VTFVFTFCVAPCVLPFLTFFGRMEAPNDATLALEAKLSELERKIERVEEEIADVVRRLKPLEEKLPKERGEEEKEEIRRLSKEKEQLRKEKEQLRKEKEQLRKEKILLLRRSDYGLLSLGLCELDLSPSSSSSIGQVSSAHVPEVELHRPCAVKSLDMTDTALPDISKILGTSTSLWVWDHVKEVFSWDPDKSYFSSEADVSSVVLQLLKSVILGLTKIRPDVSITLQQEKSISGNKSDYWIFLLNGHLVGCVEVKKPSQGKSQAWKVDPLNNPQVLGQLYDYMGVIRSFYGTTPVWGIVTTFNEWRFCKLLDAVVAETFESPRRKNGGDILIAGSPGPSFCTPAKLIEDSEKKHSSPPRVSLSSSVSGYDISVDESEETQEVEPEEDRKMWASEVYSCKDHEGLIASLGGVFLEMAQAKTSIMQLSSDSICHRTLLFFTKGDVGLGWASPKISLRWGVFLGTGTKRVFAIDDLGHGRDGRVWLVCNIGGALGVLKFVAGEKEAKKESEWWKKVYITYSWSNQVTYEKWSKRWAVVMPRFRQFHTRDERLKALNLIEGVLQENFAKNNLKHRDVKWRNIGYFLEGSAMRVILFDLSDVSVETSSDWVAEGLSYLELNA
jgi:hypothetical protein